MISPSSKISSQFFFLYNFLAKKKEKIPFVKHYYKPGIVLDIFKEKANVKRVVPWPSGHAEKRKKEKNLPWNVQSRTLPELFSNFVKHPESPKISSSILRLFFFLYLFSEVHAQHKETIPIPSNYKSEIDVWISIHFSTRRFLFSFPLNDIYKLMNVSDSFISHVRDTKTAMLQRRKLMENNARHLLPFTA